MSIQRARQLRLAMTDAERKLWFALRRKQLYGLRFRRQVPLGPYIVDFCCLEAFLVIEVDGGQHNGSLRDEVRDAWLKSEGFSLLRFWNNEVLENLEGVLWRIASFSGAGGKLTPTQPSPLKGEG